MSHLTCQILLGCALLIAVASGTCLGGDRPNIVIIMSDDMGYSDIGCYGSEVETPNLDALAAGGLRFTQFYNTGRCCPTRASLLTGLYPHQAGYGWMERDTGHAGYRGNLNNRCVTIAEVLKTAGYRTYAVGKWHVTLRPQQELPLDKQNWPLQRGFDDFFGTIMGGGSYFDPGTLTRGNTLIVPDDIKSFYYTDAISETAAQFVRDHDGSEPFFLYVAYTAAHWPLHAKPKDIAKYKGRYDDGWDVLRQRRYARMLKLGLIDESAKLSPHHNAWEDEENKPWQTSRMEVYAAMIDCMDQGIGRIVDAIEEQGQLNNTLILYLQDNGACQEEMGSSGKPRHVTDDRKNARPLQADELQYELVPAFTRDARPVRIGRGVTGGPADTYTSCGIEWANACNTPFRLYKHFVHEGGISTPLIAHWPDGIQRRGELERQPGHLIDLMATCVDLAEARYPQSFHGLSEIDPGEGVSLRPAFAGESVGRDFPIFWEHEGNRAIRDGDWKLVARGKNGPWELYNLAEDRSELSDLAETYLEKAQELAAEWEVWAGRANVYPLTPYWEQQ